MFSGRDQISAAGLSKSETNMSLLVIDNILIKRNTMSCNKILMPRIHEFYSNEIREFVAYSFAKNELLKEYRGVET